jgi:hypothetical protein
MTTIVSTSEGQTFIPKLDDSVEHALTISMDSIHSDLKNAVNEAMGSFDFLVCDFAGYSLHTLPQHYLE